MIFFVLVIICVVIGIIARKASIFLVSLSLLAVAIPVAIAQYFVTLEYEEPVLVDEIQLVSLNNSVASVSYVYVTPNNVYSYRYEVENTTDLLGKMYETDTISGNVKEIESSECEQAVLRVYVSKPKGKFGAVKYTYVFYVPEGTIVKDVILK